MTSKTMSSLALAAIASLLFAACASVPESRGERQALVSQANSTLQMMTARDPSLQEVLDRSAGYVVFPSNGEAGVLLAGGSAGVGVVFENGQPIGFARVREGTLGPQLGGQEFSELLIFQDRTALDRLRGGNFDLTANLEATALTWGVGRQLNFENGVAAIVSSETGLMAGATVGGQSITFEPMV